MAKRSRTKPVAAAIEASKEVETTPVAESAPPVESPVETAPITPESDVFEQAIASREAGQFEQPETNARVEEALAAAPVMRGSELEEPIVDTDQNGTGPNRWAGVVRDSKHKLRIDKETVRKPGHPYLRVLISFPKDAKPNEEERRLLKDERFSFDGESWYKELTGANVLLAKQVVNQIYKMRGDEYQLLV